MSTFRGEVEEFPDIMIDFFRTINGVRPPLACFLSHVHSDHLAGLESLKSPFVYCSAATKELLLRLERHPHRMNFAQGILEVQNLTYKKLNKLLKPIPLETPTELELAPYRKIQVTLFDANHCTGAAMFLIEDANHAILYTGDIRSEPWFVNRLTRSPFLVEYSSGLKTLDCIYLDTSHAGDSQEFPTKAEGLKELVGKVSKYPTDTVFHFAAWTFGYEEVWMALSRVLKSQIHVDKYKLGLYQSLRGNTVSTGGRDFAGPALSHEGSILAGYKCANDEKEGILTCDQTVRLHSCEKGTECSIISEKNVVWIRPIICRNGNSEVDEVGIGGGGGDLTQNPELELDENSIQVFLQLLGNQDPSIAEGVHHKLLKGLNSSLRSLPLHDMGIDYVEANFSLDELAKFFIRSVKQKPKQDPTRVEADANKSAGANVLSKTITFPYARHSSHAELCNLVSAFRPADVYPCTSDESSWHEGVSIKVMFGEHCSRSIFRHDSEMVIRQLSRDEDEEEEDMIETQISRRNPEQDSTPHSDIDTSMVRDDVLNSDEAPIDDTQSQNPSTNLSGGESTPLRPDESTALTPGSASQTLRRKAVEEMVYDRVKRLRFSSPVDEVQSSIPIHGEDHSEPNENLDEVDEDNRGEGIDFEADNEFAFYDGVHRCRKCGWEVWMPTGACYGCGAGEDAYEEYIGPVDAGGASQAVLANPTNNLLEFDSDSELSAETRAKLSEMYLDFASSAYSSDNDSERSEDYENNSMIDDASIASDESEGSEGSDSDESEGPVDWESKFLAMSAQYRSLERRHEVLARQHGDLLQQLDNDAKDIEGYGEGDVREIDELGVQQLEVAEIILEEPNSQVMASQQTEMPEFESVDQDAVRTEVLELAASDE